MYPGKDELELKRRIVLKSLQRHEAIEMKMRVRKKKIDPKQLQFRQAEAARMFKRLRGFDIWVQVLGGDSVFD